MSEDMDSMIDALTRYAEKSVGGIDRMGEAYYEAMRHADPKIREAGEFISSFMPGHGFVESAGLATEAGRQWRSGDRRRSLNTMADAIEAPLDELGWLIPVFPKMAGVK